MRTRDEERSVAIDVKSERMESPRIYVGYRLAEGETSGGRRIACYLSNDTLVVQVGTREIGPVEEFYVDIKQLLGRMIADPSTSIKGMDAAVVRGRVRTIKTMREAEPALAADEEDALKQSFLEFSTGQAPEPFNDIAWEILQLATEGITESSRTA